MKTVEITVEFTGYPDDTAASETRYKSETTHELEDAFADLIVRKGLAREAVNSPTTAPAQETAA